jgi:hypothetical protein
MNQFLDITKEAYSDLETFSRLVFPPHRRIVQRMSAGPTPASHRFSCLVD